MNLESHRFISYFLPEQATELCEIARVETFPKGTVIFEENEIPDSLYLVLDGKIEFSKRGGPNQFQTVAWAEENDFFGEFGVLDGQPRSARAVTCDTATIAKIPRDRLMDILERSPGRVVLQLFHHIIQYLRITTERYVSQLVYKHKMMLVGEMANTIIHDFKSPFTGISLASSMLKEMHCDDDTQEWCDLIQTQVGRMLAMAEEVLEFTQGHSVLTKRDVSLAEVFDRFKKLNQVYFKEVNIEFIVNCDKSWVSVDDNKLIRALQNIIGNAVESLEGVEGKITVDVAQIEEWVTVKITDTGPGIPEAIRDRLFEPFVTYGKHGGTGLGTAIAKSIVEAHGGEIRFESPPGKGTTFYLSLPAIETLNHDLD